MIRRINKLSGVGLFNELRSDSGSEHDFVRLNVIHASNASGKSTICDIIRSYGSGDPRFIVGRKRIGVEAPAAVSFLLSGQPARSAQFSGNTWSFTPSSDDRHNVLVYDGRFISDNVLVGHAITIDQKRNLFGLVLGVEAMKLRDTVNVAERHLEVASSNLKTSTETLMRILPKGYTIDTFRALECIENADGLIDAASVDLNNTITALNNIAAIKTRKPLQTCRVPPALDGYLSAFAITLDDMALRAESKIEAHIAASTSGADLDWISKGHKFQLNDTCPYCGQAMTGVGLLAVYRAYFTGQLQDLEQRLGGILQYAETNLGPVGQQALLQVVQANDDAKAWWSDAGGVQFSLPILPSCDRLREIMTVAYAAVDASLNRKIAQPSSATKLTISEDAAIKEWHELLVMLEAYNAGILAINEILNKRQQEPISNQLGAAEGRLERLKSCKLRHLPNTISLLAAYDEALLQKAAAEKAKTRANEELRSQSKAVFFQYGNRINDILDKFGVEIRLVSPEVRFNAGPPAGDLSIELLGVKISTSLEDAKNPEKLSLSNSLSGGDRSALGLAYFLAVAHSHPNLCGCIVVFDDPFHSQDRSRRQRTIESIHDLCQKSLQCFVLSHDLEFSREVVRGTDVKSKTFHLRRHSETVSITAAELGSLMPSAYKRDYDLLKRFEKSSDFHGAEDLVAVCRAMRQVLEGYLRAKYPSSWGDTAWLGVMIEEIAGAGSDDKRSMIKHLLPELDQLNAFHKRHYHAGDGPGVADIDPREVLQYVRQTIDVISR